MEIRSLQWDSDFFGIRIGRVDLHTIEDVSALVTQQQELRRLYDLLYVFAMPGITLNAQGAKLVDEKVVYSKYCAKREIFSDVMLYEQSFPDESLYKLALISGEHSRFKLDKRLPSGSYERLYRRWIENACPQEGDNKQIFVYIPDGTAQGMITIDHKGSHAHIGLVAVDPEFQYKGFGTKIMSSLETVLCHKGVLTIDVATQKSNVKACRWYEKNGFEIMSITPIYHWWL